MANELQGMWTAKGLEKLARHAAGGTALMLRELALGDGGGSPAPAPAPSWTALTRQVWRGMVNGVQTSPDNASQVQVDAVIPLNIGGFFIREWGLYDAEGDMVAVGAHAEFYKPVISSGASAEIVERILLPIANAGAITLTIASQAVATQQFVQAQVKAHDESPTAHGDMVRRLEEHTHPHATEDAAGLVERATDAEAQAGTDGERYVTPKQLKDAVGTTDLTAMMRDTFAGCIVEWECETIPNLTDGKPLGIELNGAIVSLTAWPRLLRKWCGAAKNATAPAWYRCNASGVRDATGDHIRLQDRRGEFARGWDHGRGVDAGRVLGSAQGDAIRNIVGSMGSITAVVAGTASGAFTVTTPSNRSAGSSTGPTCDFTFDASRVVPTASENRTRNIATLYLVLV